MLVTVLRRCHECRLLFRAPTTTEVENEAFYQTDYRQGFDSDVPPTDQLQALVQSGFAGSPKDYSTYLKLLRVLGVHQGARILDYGCSWGYGTWQLQRAGFEVVGYEISRPRAAYAREQLHVDAYSRWEEVPDGPYDVFFSAHVLEHVPSVARVVSLARQCLRRGGLWLAFTPNGSAPCREDRPRLWYRLWGRVHPNFLDDEFYVRQLENPLLASSPYDLDAIQAGWAREESGAVDALKGDELMAAVQLI